MSDPFAEELAELPKSLPTQANVAFAAPSPQAALPQDLEAEQAFLGTLLLNNDVLERLDDALRDTHFVHPLHAAIYTAIVGLAAKQRVATPLTVRPYIEAHAAFGQGSANGNAAQYLAALIESAVSPTTAIDYAKSIADAALARSLIAVGDDIKQRALQRGEGMAVNDQIHAAEHALYNLAETGRQERGFVSFAQALTQTVAQAAAALKRGGGLAGVATRLTDVDRKLGGLHPSDLLILAGRPSMGKTALATNLAFNAAVGGPAILPDGRSAEMAPVPVAFFSLEMSAEQLVGRILAEQTEIPSEQLRRGQLSDEDFQQLISASSQFENAPLYIDDTPALPVSALVSRCRRLKRQHGLGLVVIDYLQLLRPPANRGRMAENRVQELSEITQSLKALAKELNVPVLALSQLSRAVESRDDKRPMLSDLRESGSIEQDADVVMFVYREEYYLARREPREGSAEHLKWQQEMQDVRGLAELIIGKQRHGPIGTVRLQFEASLTRFGNLVGDQYDYNPE